MSRYNNKKYFEELKAMVATGEDIWINFINFRNVSQMNQTLEILKEAGYESDNQHAPQQVFSLNMKGVK